MGSAAAIARPPDAFPPRDGARAADRSRLIGRGRVAALWGAIFCLVLAAHAAIGIVWLTRALPVLEDGRVAEPAFDLDLADPAPAEDVAGPVLEPAPDVPEPTVPPAEPAEPAPVPPLEAAAPPPFSEMPLAEPTSASRRSAIPARLPVRPSPALQARERARERERAEARREAAEETRRRAVAARQTRETGASRSTAAPATPPGASAAASAAWRGQIVGILRGRFAGGARGMASVSFSVGRGGQIAGARLTASSGDARLDAAALAAFRGAVPPPPAGYVGPLTFNIRLGVR